MYLPTDSEKLARQKCPTPHNLKKKKSKLREDFVCKTTDESVFFIKLIKIRIGIIRGQHLTPDVKRKKKRQASLDIQIGEGEENKISVKTNKQTSYLPL